MIATVFQWRHASKLPSSAVLPPCCYGELMNKVLYGGTEAMGERWSVEDNLGKKKEEGEM